MPLDSTILDAALRRYTRDCRRAGAIYQQPCSASSDVDGQYVTLRCARGDLARYAFKVVDERVRLRIPV